MSTPTFSFKTEKIDEFGVKVETIDYGDVSNSVLLSAFGRHMTYSDLEPYARNPEDCNNLVCEFRWFDEKTLQFKAFLNTNEFYYESFNPQAMSIELFIILGELESQLEANEQEEEEEEQESSEEEIERVRKSSGGKAPRKRLSESAVLLAENEVLLAKIKRKLQTELEYLEAILEDYQTEGQQRTTISEFDASQLLCIGLSILKNGGNPQEFDDRFTSLGFDKDRSAMIKSLCEDALKNKSERAQEKLFATAQREVIKKSKEQSKKSTR